MELEVNCLTIIESSVLLTAFVYSFINLFSSSVSTLKSILSKFDSTPSGTYTKVYFKSLRLSYSLLSIFRKASNLFSALCIMRFLLRSNLSISGLLLNAPVSLSNIPILNSCRDNSLYSSISRTESLTT